MAITIRDFLIRVAGDERAVERVASKTYKIAGDCVDGEACIMGEFRRAVTGDEAMSGIITQDEVRDFMYARLIGAGVEDTVAYFLSADVAEDLIEENDAGHLVEHDRVIYLLNQEIPLGNSWHDDEIGKIERMIKGGGRGKDTGVGGGAADGGRDSA